MKCHITTNRFEKLLGWSLFYGVRVRFSGKEGHILTIISGSGRQITLPSVHNFNHWNDYMNLAVRTMHLLSENREESENAS